MKQQFGEKFWSFQLGFSSARMEGGIRRYGDNRINTSAWYPAPPRPFPLYLHFLKKSAVAVYQKSQWPANIAQSVQNIARLLLYPIMNKTVSFFDNYRPAKGVIPLYKLKYNPQIMTDSKYTTRYSTCIVSINHSQWIFFPIYQIAYRYSDGDNWIVGSSDVNFYTKYSY